MGRPVHDQSVISCTTTVFEEQIMHVFIRRALCAGALFGGVTAAGLALTTSPAAADDGPLGSTLSSLASKSHDVVRAHVPVDVRGNQVTVLGHHNHAGSPSTTSPDAPAPAPARPPTSSGDGGGDSPEGAAVAVWVPVRVQHQQVTVIGHDNRTGGPARAELAPSVRTTRLEPGSRSDGTDPFLAGDRSLVSAEAPITLCGNQVTIIGSGNATTCSEPTTTPSGPAGAPGDGPAAEEGATLLNGRNLADVLAPVAVTGNQVTVIGDGNTSGGSTGSTGGDDGTASSDPGNTPAVEVLTPVTTTGNQVTVIGDGNTNGGSTGSTGGDDGTRNDTGNGTGDDTDDGTSAPGTGSEGGTGAGTGDAASGATTATGTEHDTDAVGTASGGDAQGAGAVTAGALPGTGSPAGLLAILLTGLLLLLGGALLRRPTARRLHRRAVPDLAAWQDLERALRRR